MEQIVKSREWMVENGGKGEVLLDVVACLWLREKREISEKENRMRRERG